MSILKKRVVITGLGLATPLGANKDIVWRKLINGESGIRRISQFDPSEVDSKIAGQIISGTNEDLGEINFDNYISTKDASRVDRFIHHAYVASEEAMKDSGFIEYFSNLDEKDKSLLQERFGVFIGSGIGGLSRIEKTAIEMYLYNIEKNTNAIKKTNPIRDPFFIPASLINLLSGHISIKYSLKGPNISHVSACATGAHSIGEAYNAILNGSCDVMICGGSEAAICKMGIAGFSAMKALSTKYNDSPEKASRPWNKTRDGFVMGEGCGILILEDLKHAQKRNAKIYAEIVGYGASSDAYHISAPESSGDGGKRAMKNALKMAGISILDVDYLNAHGTSTPLGDLIELNAIKSIFSDELNREATISDMSSLKISSTKSSIGHLLGAAGAVEGIFSILSIVNNQIPLTLNLNCDNIEDFASNFNIIHEGNYKDLNNLNIRIAASNSFGFGGTNASLIFKRYEF